MPVVVSVQLNRNELLAVTPPIPTYDVKNNLLAV